MSTYAIGDLQGCFATLERLLSNIGFRRERDTLWFVGDLVNRGEDSLACLRFVRSLQEAERAVAVLGNHDLHLLAVAEGLGRQRASDTLDAVLAASDRDALLGWLRRQPLLHVQDRYAMVHAGLLPAWSWRLAQSLAHDVESLLRGRAYRRLLAHMYGNTPAEWRTGCRGMARHRLVINVLTRMRALDMRGEIPAIEMSYKGSLADIPAGCAAWFETPSVRRAARTVIAGHWSALGLHRADGFIGLDTGCIWGGPLTALRLEDGRVFQAPCAERTPLRNDE